MIDPARDDITIAHFTHATGTSDLFSSLLYFRSGEPAIGGPRAIDRYLASEGDGRLIQSMKSYLADRTFQATNIFGRTTPLVDLLALFLREVRARAEENIGPLGSRAVVGRPVHFASEGGADDEALAVSRLRAALASAGWDDVVLEYEPVAAAHFYESRLDHDELVLIADFGGGTSDFSLVRVGPGQRERGVERILGSDGVGLAGDTLDSRLLHKLVAPMLGLGTTYRTIMSDKELPVPVWIYSRLLRWHHLSFLKSRKNLEMLEGIASQTSNAKPIRALLHVIENDLGYHLYRAIEQTKVALSTEHEARFTFSDAPLELDAKVTRREFEKWIAEDLHALETCVDGLLARVSVDRKDIDQVFMTGGTSFVPSVRKIFVDRFGADRIRAGGELVSVASGLALLAAR